MKRNKPEDVWKKIRVGGKDECWNWLGHTTNAPNGAQGYGYFGIDGGCYVTHRIVYALSNPGTIEFKAPKDKTVKEFVLHTCDNRLCCNPGHMFLGNYDDNNKDASKKGRSRGGDGTRGEEHHLAKLTMKKAREIRGLFQAGHTRSMLAERYNVCHQTICNIINNRRYAE